MSGFFSSISKGRSADFDGQGYSGEYITLEVYNIVFYFCVLFTCFIIVPRKHHTINYEKNKYYIRVQG